MSSRSCSGRPCRSAERVAYWKHAPKTVEEYEASERGFDRIFEKCAVEEPDSPWIAVWRGLLNAEDVDRVDASFQKLADIANRGALRLARSR